MCAKGYAYRARCTGSNRYPEVIDVGRDTIDFRSKGDRRSGHMDKVPMTQLPLGMFEPLSVSVGQAAKERKR